MKDRDRSRNYEFDDYEATLHNRAKEKACARRENKYRDKNKYDYDDEDDDWN